MRNVTKESYELELAGRDMSPLTNTTNTAVYLFTPTVSRKSHFSSSLPV